MKILSITAQKPNSTGSGTYLTEVVRALDNLGHKQAVVAGIYEDDLPSIKFPKSVDFYPVIFDEHNPIYGMSDSMPYPSALYSSLDEAGLAAFEARFEPVLRKAVQELDPDIIYCHHLFVLTALVRRLFPEKKVYGQCHGTDLRQFINCKQLQEHVRADIAGLDRIYCLHHEQYRQIAELFGVDADVAADAKTAAETATDAITKASKSKIEVVGCGYNEKLFYPGDRLYSKADGSSGGLAGGSGKAAGSDGSSGGTAGSDESRAEFLYAGKLCRAKGVNELLHAAASLDCADFKLTLVGGCQDDNTLAIYQSVRSDRINWLGPLPQSELAELFREKDVFVLPSYFEGLCLAVIEALASGMLVICTDLPMREWLDANIPDNNIIYVELPEMASLDRPVSGGEEVLEKRLAEAFKQAMGKLREERKQPDMRMARWTTVAEKILTE